MYFLLKMFIPRPKPEVVHTGVSHVESEQVRSHRGPYGTNQLKSGLCPEPWVEESVQVWLLCRPRAPCEPCFQSSLAILPVTQCGADQGIPLNARRASQASEARWLIQRPHFVGTIIIERERPPGKGCHSGGNGTHRVFAMLVVQSTLTLLWEF